MPDPTVSKPKSKIPSFDEVMAKPPIPSFKNVMGEKKNGGGNGLKQSAPITLPSQGGKPFGVFQEKAAQSQQIFPTKENPLPLVDKTAPQPVPTNTFTPDISNNFGLPKATDIAKQNSALKDNTQAAAIPVLKRKNVLGEDSGELAEGQDEGVKLAKEYAENKKLLDTRTNILNSQILNTYQDAAVAKGDMVAPKLFTPIPIKDKQPVIESLDAEKNDVVVRANALKKETIKKAGAYAAKMDANATTAGLTTRAILGDKAAIQQSEFLDKGLPVAPSDMFHNDQQGLEALSEGIDEQYKDDLSNPEYLAKKQDIQNQSRTLIDKYPEFKRQQISKIVAQEIMKDHPNADGMMILPYGMEAAKKLGLSEEDIKNIDFDNLPIQSPLSSAVGAVYNGIISLGAGAARILGSAVGMDEDVLTANLNEATRNATERFEDVSTTQQLPSIVDANKNSPTYLQNIENPEAGKYNYNFHTIANAIGQGMGGLAQFVGGTKVVGGIIKGALPFADATEAGMAGIMVLQGYEPYYKQATEVISDKPEDEWKRHAFALINGSLDYLGFRTLGKVVKEIAPETKDELANIFKEAPSLAKVNRNALTKWTQKVIKGIEGTASETAFVGGATAGSEIAKNIVINTIGTGEAAKKANRELGDVLLKGVETLPFAIAIPVSTSKVIAGARNSFLYKENIYNAGLNPETYLGQANKLLHDGVISQDQFNQRAQVINTATKVVNSIPADIELNHNQRVAYTNSKVRELALKAQAEKVDDAALEKFYADQIKQEVDARTEILNGGSKEPSYVQPETDTKLSEPIQGVDEQGIPIGENVPAPENKTNETSQTETKVSQSTEKASTTNETVGNVSQKAESGANEADLISEAKDIVNTDVVKGFSAETLKDAANNKPEDFKNYLSEIAQQAHDDKSVKATVDTYGQPLVDIATKLFPKEEAKPYDPNSGKVIVEPSKPISEMNSEEIGAYANDVRQALKKQDKEFANKTEKEKEDGGYYDYIDNVAELRDTEQRVNFVENSENLDDLANSTKSALRDFNKDNPSQESLAILNAAKIKAAEMNIEPETLIKEVIKKVGNDYKDKNDAEFMMRNYLEKIVPTEKQAEQQPIVNSNSEVDVIDKGKRETNNYEDFKNKKNIGDSDIKNMPISEVDKYSVFDRGAEGQRGGTPSETVDNLVRSIKQFGLVEPIHIKTDGNKSIIEDGNTRVAALKKIGVDNIPVYIEKVERFSERDNRLIKQRDENKPTISKEQTEPTTKEVEGVSSNSNEDVKSVEELKNKNWYHGSESEFHDFENKNPRITGFWFSDSKDNAATYGEKVKAVNLDIKTPLIIDAKGKKFTNDIDVEVLAKYPNEKPYYTKIGLDIDEIVWMVKNGKRPNSFIEIPNHSKYDAVVFKNIIDPSLSSKSETPQTSIAVLNRDQIKTASPTIELKQPTNERTTTEVSPTIPTEIKEPKGQGNKEAVQSSTESVGRPNAEAAPAVPLKSKLAAFKKKYADIVEVEKPASENVNSNESKDVKFSVTDKESEAVSDMKDIVKDYMDNGTTKLKDIQSEVAKELENDTPALKRLVEDAFNSVGKELKIADTDAKGQPIKNELTTSFAKRINSFVDKIFGKSDSPEGHTVILKDGKAVMDAANKVSSSRFQNVNAVFEGRDGKAIGFNYDTDQVARERFDFSKLKQIGKGSDRTVFELDNNMVLKVAHTARGLDQNIHEGDYYLKGIVPEVYERGLNYVVTDNVARIKASDIVPTYDVETGVENGTARAGDMLNELGKFNQIDFDNKTNGVQDAINKYGFGDVLSYDILYGDFKAGRNWGYKDGMPVHIDGGTFGGVDMIDSYKGKAPLTDPEFRDIYNKSRALKKEFGDADKFTKFMKNAAGEVLGFTDPSTGRIYLNGEKLNPNTPIHEAGHIWTNWAKENDAPLHKRGLELTENSKYLKKVKDNKFYQDEAAKLPKAEQENYYREEALASAIGDKGAQFVSESRKKSFAEWAKQLWDNVAKAAGFKDVSAKDLQDMTLDEFSKRAATDILKGEPQKSDAGKGNKPPTEKVKVAEGEDNSIGIRHVDTAEMREERKLPEYEKKATTIPEINAEADKRIKEGKMPELIQRLEEGGGLTGGVEQAMLGKYIAKLNDTVEANPTKENIAEFDKAMRLNEIAGTTSFGQVGRVRQERYLPENSFGESLRDEAMSLGVKTEDLPKDVLDKIEQEHKEMDQLRKDLSKAEAENERLRKERKAKVEVQKIIKESRKASKRDFKAERQSLKEKLRSQFDDYKAAGNKLGIASDGGVESFVITAKMAKTITDIVKSYADEGVAKFDDLVNKAFDDVKDVLGNIKKKDIVDVLAGDYNEKLPTRSELAQRMRDIRTEASLLKKLNDARLGKEPASKEGKAKKSKRISDLENRIKEIRKNNNDDTPVEQTEGQRLAAKEKAMLKKIASIEADVKAGKFQKEEPLPPVILDKKALAIQDRLIELEGQQANRRAKQDYENLSKWDRGMDTFWQVAGLRRLVNAAVDASIVFRQAAPVTFNPFKYLKVEKGRIVKGTALKAWASMYNTAFSPKAFKRFQYNLEKSDAGRLFTHFNGVFSNPSEVKMEKREEEFTNSLLSRLNQKIQAGKSGTLKKAADVADKVWFSERAAASFLNTIRIEEFSRQVTNLRRGGITPENNPEAYKDAVKWSMNITGRGNMAKVLEDSHAGRIIANRTYFGARLMAAKVNMLNPLTYARMEPKMRNMALKDMAGTTGGMVMLGLAGMAAGGTVSLNPDDPDFFQLRFGDKVFDLTGGSVAYVRTFLRFIKAIGGQVKNPNSPASNSYTSFAGKSIAKSLVVNKLSPNNSYLYHFWTRKSGQYDEGGHLKPFDPYEIVRIYPMYVDGTVSAYEKGGLSDALSIMIPDLFGIGTQQYVKETEIPAGGGGGASSANY